MGRRGVLSAVMRRRVRPGKFFSFDGGRAGTAVLSCAFAAVVLMASLQGSFLSSVRGQSSLSRARLDAHASSLRRSPAVPFEAARDRALAALRERERGRDGDGDGGGGTVDAADACALLVPSAGDFTAAEVWTRYVSSVVAASRHPDDPEYAHESWTRSVLAELSPSALRRSSSAAASLVEDGAVRNAVGRVMQRIAERLSDPEQHPPLRIAVLGGGTTEGRGCDVAGVDFPGEASIMANPTYCAWPFRFESLVNSLFGVAGSRGNDGSNDGNINIVEVTNLAEDGTDTAFMTPLVKNWIYPPSLLPEGPDIVVNAYDTDDYTSYDPSGGASSAEETVRAEMDAFVAAVGGSHPCGDPPLVVHMDDSGSEDVPPPPPSQADDRPDRGGALLTLRYGSAVSRAARADRDATRGRLPPDAPFGMAGHAALAWVLAFNFLDAAMGYCAAPSPPQPPPSRRRSGEDGKKCRDASTGDSPCVFAWFAGPMGTVTRPSQISEYLLPFTSLNTGWQVQSDMSTGFSRKTGLVAAAPGAAVAFEFRRIRSEIRRLNIMTLRSAGARWAGGKARFGLLVNPAPSETDNGGGGGERGEARETTFEIEGSHSSPNHITYHFEVDLEDNRARVGDDVVLRIDLVEGSSFKILGLMLCA